jgi:hypothetical protein
MTQNNQPANDASDELRKEAKDYVESLPDETAEGRLVDDDGTTADTTKWDSEEAKQQAKLNPDA